MHGPMYIKFIDAKQAKSFTNSKTSKENCIEQTQLSGTTNCVDKRGQPPSLSTSE